MPGEPLSAATAAPALPALAHPLGRRVRAGLLASTTAMPNLARAHAGRRQLLVESLASQTGRSPDDVAQALDRLDAAGRIDLAELTAPPAPAARLPLGERS